MDKSYKVLGLSCSWDLYYDKIEAPIFPKVWELVPCAGILSFAAILNPPATID